MSSFFWSTAEAAEAVVADVDVATVVETSDADAAAGQISTVRSDEASETAE